jgi:hypothetical protein
MRLRNGRKGEASPTLFPHFAPNTHIYLYAKQFTMMQQICANGPLHIPEECVILAEYIYRNRHPTTALFTTQQINQKPEHR